MSNHYHPYIQTPEPNLVAGMAWLQNTLMRRYNVRHCKWARLFVDRYKAVRVERLDKRAVSEEIKSCGVPPQSEEVDARASHLRCGWRVEEADEPKG